MWLVLVVVGVLEANAVEEAEYLLHHNLPWRQSQCDAAACCCCYHGNWIAEETKRQKKESKIIMVKKTNFRRTRSVCCVCSFDDDRERVS